MRDPELDRLMEHLEEQRRMEEVADPDMAYGGKSLAALNTAIKALRRDHAYFNKP